MDIEFKISQKPVNYGKAINFLEKRVNKVKFQRIWSQTRGIWHRMVYRDDNGYYIKRKNERIPITHIEKDLWQIKDNGK